MIPMWWQTVVLGLAGYRISRLVGWDDFPPIQRIRQWATGETLYTRGSSNSRQGLTNEPLEAAIAYDRPMLEHFLHCAYCTGWWVALAEYAGWLYDRHWTMLVAYPFALAAIPGLVARNLDP